MIFQLCSFLLYDLAFLALSSITSYFGSITIPDWLSIPVQSLSKVCLTSHYVSIYIKQLSMGDSLATDRKEIPSLISSNGTDTFLTGRIHIKKLISNSTLKYVNL